ncbi:MAG: NADH-quinone oxidoreductase subunit C [Phycisphaerae bacterium]|jgi:NADH-quinone oxidoreductase subunit C
MATEDCVRALQERFPELGIEARPLCTYLDGRDSGQYWVRVPAERLLEVLGFLRDDPRTRFEQLCDLTCVDYLSYPGAEDRFGVVYSLLSYTHNHRLWVKAFVNDPEPALPSATSLWRGAEWPEREVYDLFGIRFDGHPDLRRIVLPQNFTEHPLRKDYPLRGKGEREAFEVVGRDSA